MCNYIIDIFCGDCWGSLHHENHEAAGSVSLQLCPGRVVGLQENRSGASGPRNARQLGEMTLVGYCLVALLT